MKKSMLTLVGCALAAGTVMAAEVAGNNVAVVIQKEPVVSSNLYQFLIVPVRGFDITGNKGVQTLKLKEILPPAAYPAGTKVYKNGSADIYTVYNNEGAIDNIWVKVGTTTEADVSYSAKDILWMQAPGGTTSAIPDSVFCGEVSDTGVVVTPVAGQFVAFGNATSEAVAFSDITLEDGIPAAGDMIYLIQAGVDDYDILYHNGANWTKKPTAGINFTPVTDADKLPAGAAAYYYRK